MDGIYLVFITYFAISFPALANASQRRLEKRAADTKNGAAGLVRIRPGAKDNRSNGIPDSTRSAT